MICRAAAVARAAPVPVNLNQRAGFLEVRGRFGAIEDGITSIDNLLTSGAESSGAGSDLNFHILESSNIPAGVKRKASLPTSNPRSVSVSYGEFLVVDPTALPSFELTLLCFVSCTRYASLTEDQQTSRG